MSDRSGGALPQSIVEYIDGLGLVPGDKIPSEAEFCRYLGVSRPKIREALRSLETLGIVAGRQGSRRTVQRADFGTLSASLRGPSALDHDYLIDFLAIRQTLEFNTITTALPHISAAVFAELDDVVTAMENHALAGNAFLEEDRRFHNLLYKGTGNRVMQELLDLFWKMFASLDRHAMTHSERLEETASHHRRILDALRAGDSRRAQYHLDTHFYDIAWALDHRDGRVGVSSPHPPDET